MNLYNKLLGVIPSSRIDVGTVNEVRADGVTVQLQNGGTVRVKGNATNGSVVYIQSGAIIGTAPSLTGVDIDV